MTKFLFIFILISILLPATAQKAINYKPRSLKKSLRNLDCSKKTDLINFPIPITAHNGPDEKGQYFILSDNECNESASYVFIGRVNTCRSGGCVVHYGNSKEISYEYFDYFIIYDVEGKVELVKVFKYEATHGHEITAKRWLKQFKNYAGEMELRVGKEVDGITGATTSSITISYDIQERTKRLHRAIKVYKKHILEILFPLHFK